MDLRNTYLWQAYQQGLQPSPPSDSWQDDDEESQLSSLVAKDSNEGSQLSSGTTSFYHHSHGGSQLSSITSSYHPHFTLQPPQVINVQEHIDHANNRHSQPTTIYRGITSITSGHILSVGLTYAGFDNVNKETILTEKLDGSKHFMGLNKTLLFHFLWISRMNIQISFSKIAS